MADWTRAADLRAQADKLWRRGTVQRAALDPVPTDDAPFPHRLSLRVPRPAELSARFDEARAWVREIDALPHVRIERRTSRHRELGTNTLPAAAWLDTPEAAAGLGGHRRELERFRELARDVASHEPRLVAWVRRHPHRALELADALPALLRAHAALVAARGNGRYLRELDVSGVDTKFVEGHRDTLGAWLDLVLEPHEVDRTHAGVRGFARRYGFRDRPERLRLRSLDPRLPLVRGAAGAADLAAADVTLDVASVAALDPAHRHVLIVENEINYLSLPALDSTLAVFGAGYGTGTLGRIDWLAGRQVHYWGDIDTHGFAILDELRAHLPQARSLLMDRRTLLEHRAFWATEPSPARRTLPRLNADERALHEELVERVHGEAVRLEQERLPFGTVVAALRERTRSSARDRECSSTVAASCFREASSPRTALPPRPQ